MDMIVRRELSRRPWTLALLIFAVLALLFTTRSAARDHASFSPADDPADPGLSVMTYNVEGLPWPVALGRAEALEAIGNRLATMRVAGRQPHIVLLQEAFREEARAIPAASGYRYVAFGPPADMAGAAAVMAEDQRFEHAGSFLKGERSGKLLGSGLLILSDYPIIAMKRAPFPAFACAGYDCLANKGMVMAELALPGGRHVAIVDLHFNSRGASGVGDERADEAYRRQTEALATFLAANRREDVPTIVAGDFNIGKSPKRRAMMTAALGGPVPDALSICADTHAACTADGRQTRHRAKDWQFLLPGDNGELRARRITTPFGHEADGSMLSDHIGYTAYYDLIRETRQPVARG